MYVRRHSEVSADLLGMPEQVRRTVRIGELLVATASSDLTDDLERKLDGELQSLALDADSYRDLVDGFVQAAEAMPDAWYFVALSRLAVANRWVAFDELLSGGVHRRIDALYDLFHTEYCAHQIQADYVEYVEVLREASKTGWMKAGEKIALYGGGFAGGWFGVGSKPAIKATEWIDERGTRPTDLTFELAELAMAWDHLSAVDDFSEAALTAVRARCSGELTRIASNYGTTGAREGDWNMWKLVVEHLAAKNDASTATEAPDLVGHALHAAQFQLDQLGIRHMSVDAVVDEFGNSRDIWSKKNWRVVGQYPTAGSPLEAGTPVALAAVKQGEGASRRDAFTRARESFEELRKFIEEDRLLAEAADRPASVCAAGLHPRVWVDPNGRCWKCQP